MDVNEVGGKEIPQKKLLKVIADYVDVVRQGVSIRWKLLSYDLTKAEVFEVIGGLLARQANLTIELARNPGVWNPHISTLIFRAHIDGYITLAWILEGDFVKRAQDYIMYGLGQEKLQIEHLKDYLENKASKEERTTLERLISERRGWLNSQLYDFFTTVDVGSWSGKTMRDMAIEARCLDIYNFAYAPFSNSAHSTWPHVARYDLRQCENPLHGYHRVPTVSREYDIDFEDWILSSKYVEKTFNLVDAKMKLNVRVPLPKVYLLRELNKG